MGLLLLTGVGACSSPEESAPTAAEDTAGETGIRGADPDAVADLLEDPPDGLQILDLRTPDEFAEGHIEGATMIDFYEPDFAEQLGELDRDRPYVIYCRSGSRSGQTREVMADLGFADVTDLDGGVLAWTADGHELTR